MGFLQCFLEHNLESSVKLLVVFMYTVVTNWYSTLYCSVQFTKHHENELLNLLLQGSRISSARKQSSSATIPAGNKTVLTSDDQDN